jgi:hypothetical protein
MSDAELRISLQLDEANRKLDALTGKFNTAAAAGKKLAGQGVKSNKALSKSIDGLVTKVGALGAAYISAAGAAKAFSLASTSAKARDSIKVLEAAGGSIEKLRAQTKGLIDDATLAKNANLARTMGISADEFAKLANIANAAAKATGESAEFMLESIVKGTARGSKLLLDNLGILIDNNKVKAEAAKLQAKNNKLSDEGAKKQAFINETLRVGNRIMDEVAESGANASEKYARAEASLKNFSLSVGNFLGPAVGDALDYMVPLVDELSRMLNFMDKFDSKLYKIRANAVDKSALFSQAKGIFDDADIYRGTIGERERLKRLKQLYDAGRLLKPRSLDVKIKGLQDAEKMAQDRQARLGDILEKLGIKIEAGRRLRGIESGRTKQGLYGKSGKGKLEFDRTDVFAGVRTKGDKEAEFNLSFALGQDDINAAYAEEAEIRAAIAAEKAADAEAEAYAEEQANIQRTENAAMEHAQWQGYAADRRDARRAEIELERALHKERQAMNQEAQAWTMHGINTAVSLAQSGIQMMADEQDHILERLGIQALAEVGNILVAEGTRYAAEGAAFLIKSGGTDPRGYAMAGLATAAIGAGIGMGGAAAFGSAHFAKMDARSADSVGANATRVRTSNSRRVSSGADGGVNLTVVYNGVGPGADEQAKAMVKIMDVARRRGFLQ